MRQIRQTRAFPHLSVVMLRRERERVIDLVRIPGRTHEQRQPNMRRRFASTAIVREEPAHDLLEPVRIFLIEGSQTGGIDIEHADEPTARVADRYDDFRPRTCVARDVTRKAPYVWNDDPASLGRSRAAYPATERDLEATERALVRPDAQQARSDDPIEPCPQMPERVVGDRADRGHDRDLVVDIGQNADELCVELWIRPVFGLVTQVERGFSHPLPRDYRGELEIDH